ncbi:Uncharacterised protein [Enterobacter cloacae]|uniref:Uncharacterized protein n=1 Tax=Enterobacter cloacae TaxID=550 RepID=A0A377LVM1_ENTCL|nr:Uncharacterised protein [Enterobacter cloacae]
MELEHFAAKFQASDNFFSVIVNQVALNALIGWVWNSLYTFHQFVQERPCILWRDFSHHFEADFRHACHTHI